MFGNGENCALFCNMISTKEGRKYVGQARKKRGDHVRSHPALPCLVTGVIEAAKPPQKCINKFDYYYTIFIF